MELTLILGPMKSGKSFELISYFMPLKYTDIPFALYQSMKNIRSENIWSRNGVSLEAKKVDTLAEILESNLKIVGIDEIHMFNEKEAEIIEKLLKKNIEVIISGLATDYKGNMFSITKKLIELGPKEIKYKMAVCETCKKPNAVYTQVYENSKPVLEGLSSIVPEDGTYEYKVVCRKCFKRS